LYIQEAFNEYGAFNGFDIAILTLATPAAFSSRIAPICVGSYELPLGFTNQQPLELTGFGRDKYEFHDLLQTSNRLKLLSVDECKDKLSPRRLVKDGQLCVIPQGSDGFK
jgi:hypothetical protein